MHSLDFHNLARWFFQVKTYGPAILVTIGAALLIVSSIDVAGSRCEEKECRIARRVK
jgi:hypothetical protein